MPDSTNPRNPGVYIAQRKRAERKRNNYEPAPSLGVANGGAMLDIQEARSSKDKVAALKRQCYEIAAEGPNDIQEDWRLTAAHDISYYNDVRRQAQQSFQCALGAAAVGTTFFVYSAWQAMEGNNQAYISLLAGALIQVISGISFYLYSRTARHFAAFHICLERTNRFILADAISQNMGDDLKRDTMREELVRIVANSPMLSLDLIDGKARSISRRNPRPDTKSNQTGPHICDRGASHGSHSAANLTS